MKKFPFHCVEWEFFIKTFFKVGRVRHAMHSNGQGLFVPHEMFEPQSRKYGYVSFFVVET